jgi:hypothetical protein
LTFSGHYVFGRNRREKPELNDDTTIELYYPFETLGEPPRGISKADYLEMFRQSKVYLIGTGNLFIHTEYNFNLD